MEAAPKKLADQADRINRAMEAIEKEMADLWMRHNGTHATPAQINRMMDTLSDDQLQRKIEHYMDLETPAP